MQDLPAVILYASFSGITVLLGGLLSYMFQQYFRDGLLKEEIIHFSVAFGGGIIVAAVSLVLVPEGLREISVMPMALLFLGGAVVFSFLDRVIEKKGGSLAQLLAMLLDYVPEAIALGAVFGVDHELGLLLAIFIGLQNLPESFNSYRDLRQSGYSVRKCLRILLLLSFSGLFAAVLGYLLLSDLPQLTASLMLVASGGALYLIFQDIAPMSKLQQSGVPALGGSLGFLVGMIGEKLLG